VLRRLGYVAIARGSVEQRLDSYVRVRHAARQGGLVHFFPEGTITGPAGVRPFRLGAFLVAAELGVPLVPVAIQGSRGVLRDGERWPMPGEIVVKVLDPIAPPPDTSAAAIGATRDRARALLAGAAGEPLIEVTSAALGACAGNDAARWPDPPAHTFY
jgi:1-acyl-sn-glycerol-3-phosphate acyltransferase